jgi:hypothetical protein
MKTLILSLGGALLGVIMAVDCLGAAGDERFYGGSYDGYDQLSYIQYDTNSASLVNARFTGGNYDGYDLLTKTNTSIRAGVTIAGTVFYVR